MKQTSKRDERVIDHLRSAITDGTAGLADVPALVRRVISEKLWRERLVFQTGETISFASFDEFVRAAPPDGLGVNVKILTRLCAHEPEIVDLIDRTANRGKRGGDRRSAKFKAAAKDKTHNVTIGKKSWGNSQSYALKRLREERPDLHRRVLDKGLSVNQAMLEAGLRRKTISLPLDTKRAAILIRRYFNKKEIEQFILYLTHDAEVSPS